MIRSTFTRLLGQHWVGIRKDEGQTQDICKGDLCVHGDGWERSCRDPAGVPASVFPLLAVTKGREPPAAPERPTLSEPHARVRAAAADQARRLEGAAERIRAGRKVVFRRRLNTECGELHKQPVLIRFLLTAPGAPALRRQLQQREVEEEEEEYELPGRRRKGTTTTKATGRGKASSRGRAPGTGHRAGPAPPVSRSPPPAVT